MSFTDSSFIDFLKHNGWVETDQPFNYKKGNWLVCFDTSSWMEIGTNKNPRVFDVPVPENNTNAQWAIKLIEHLCKTDEELFRLRGEKSKN